MPMTSEPTTGEIAEFLSRLSHMMLYQLNDASEDCESLKKERKKHSDILVARRKKRTNIKTPSPLLPPAQSKPRKTYTTRYLERITHASIARWKTAMDAQTAPSKSISNIAH